jgi:hypothetical protein
MHKLLLISLVVAAPLLIAPTSASWMGWWLGWSGARYTAMRPAAMATRRVTAAPNFAPRLRCYGPRICSWRGWGHRRWGGWRRW